MKRFYAGLKRESNDISFNEPVDFLKPLNTYSQISFEESDAAGQKYPMIPSSDASCNAIEIKF